MEVKLLVVNDMKIGNSHFPRKLTFIEGSVWKSMLGYCIVSSELVKYVKSFSILHDMILPSDHAPMLLTLSRSCVNLPSLLSRAMMLGDHAVLHSNIK